MDQEDRLDFPLTPSLTASSLKAARVVMRSGIDVSHRLFEELELAGLRSIQSIYHGVTFRRCILRDCIFDRSDFEGVRFESCIITNVSWNYTDIRSTMFADCNLTGCKFDEAHITDNFFVRSLIISCSFLGTTLASNDFRATQVQAIQNQRATIIHNAFKNCSFHHARLADCTALYSIFENCSYENFVINADSLGLSYGLDADVISKIELLFLGKEQFWPDSITAAEAIIQSFQARKWLLHWAIAKLCYSNIPRMDAWRLVIDVIVAQINAGHGTTLDEAKFVTRIARHLCQQKRLPFAALVYGYDSLNLLAFDENDPTAESQTSTLLLNEFTLLLATAHDLFVAASDEIVRFPSNKKLLAEFHFASRPEQEPSLYLKYLIDQASLTSMEIMPSRVGSWIQPLHLTVEALGSILASLYLLEGCIVQLTRIRARTSVLISRDMPVPYLQYAEKPKQQMPEILEKAVRHSYESYLDGTLNAPPREAELTSDQLKEIRVIEPVPRARPSRSKKKQSL